MKLLIGAACVSVIALAAYIIGGDYYGERTAKRAAFQRECDRLSALGGDTSGIAEKDRAKTLKAVDACIEWMKTGRYPI